jgi:hypothetical protein
MHTANFGARCLRNGINHFDLDLVLQVEVCVKGALLLLVLGLLKGIINVSGLAAAG